MQIFRTPVTRLIFSLALVLNFASVSLRAEAQTVKKHADGTVEVLDDEESSPAPHTSSRASGGHSGGSSGKIPAYTKRMGGVNVHRNADGTIEVTDMEMKTTYTGGSAPARFAKKSTAKKSGTTHSAAKKKK